jgi:aerobic carbon-monoxide dehydrogenase large subunit
MKPNPKPDRAFDPLRVEDTRLLQGRGQFLRDIRLPHMQHVAFVRSPYAHAKIIALDTAAAQLLPGVVKIFTGADFAGLAGPNAVDGQLCMPPPNPLVQSSIKHNCPLLPQTVTTYLGQPIAVVVANSETNARLAADSLHADLQALASTNDLSDTNSDDALFRVTYKTAANTSGNPAVVVNVNHQQPRVTAMALETRGAVASYVAKRLTVWLANQSPSRARDDFANMLSMAPDTVRVICPDVGGAFGAKGSVYPEEYLVALVAKTLQCNAVWISSRSEEFLTSAHGRGGHLQGSLAVDAQGKFIQVDAQFRFPLGAWLPYSAAIPARNSARIFPGPYLVPSVNIDSSAYLSHAAPMNIYRGAGRPEAALVMERLIDKAAGLLQIDPVQLRLRNLVGTTSLPYKTPTGESLDSGDYTEALELACKKFAYSEKRREQTLRRSAGELVGIGVAMYVEPCGQGWESATVTLSTDGTVIVASGSSAQGQGHETSYAAIAAAQFGCAAAQVKVIQGDTAQCPDGIGALASRSIAIGGSAILQACKAILAKQQAGASLPITEAIKYTASAETWSYGCVISQVSIDHETGKLQIEKIVWVDDAGNIVSPQLALGQLIGGAAQGIGQTLMERLHYDNQGQLTTGSLMDYAVPRATDMPPIQIHSLMHQSPSNALGAKGVGEAGCIGVPASILNAACDALRAFEGSDQLDFPLTAPTLWQAMQPLHS